jgi:GNAT superfamily N-acetyltransferase
MLRVGRASPEDADALAQAYEWLFEPPGVRPPDWDAERAAAAIRAVTESDDAVILVVRDGGRIVGLCSVYLDIQSVRFGQRAWVEDLAVDPRSRSGGIGKLLLEAAKDWARAHGAKRLALESAEARVDAHRFYEREQPGSRAMCFGWPL